MNTNGPDELPEVPDGWRCRMTVHLKLSGGALYAYDVLDPDGHVTPITRVVESQRGAIVRSGFALPSFETLMTWSELRVAWGEWKAQFALRCGVAEEAESERRG